MDQFVHFGPFKIQTQASVDFERFRDLSVRYSDPHHNFIFILKRFAKNFMHFDLFKLFFSISFLFKYLSLTFFVRKHYF